MKKIRFCQKDVKFIFFWEEILPPFWFTDISVYLYRFHS